MTQKTLNIGTVANDGTGDTLREAGDKINYNFGVLFDRVDIAVMSATGTIPLSSSFIFCNSPSPITLTLQDGGAGDVKRIVNRQNTTITINGTILQGTTVTMTGKSTCAFIWSGAEWALFQDAGISVT